MTVSVLVDTSVWIAHFRHGNAQLANLLAHDCVLMHDFVLLEIACGTPPAPRARTLATLALLRMAPQASTSELLDFISRQKLYNRACGMVDISLLASTRLASDARLWTLDKPLHALARQMGLAWEHEQNPI